MVLFQILWRNRAESLYSVSLNAPEYRRDHKHTHKHTYTHAQNIGGKSVFSLYKNQWSQLKSGILLRSFILIKSTKPDNSRFRYKLIFLIAKEVKCFFFLEFSALQALSVHFSSFSRVKKKKRINQNAWPSIVASTCCMFFIPISSSNFKSNLIVTRNGKC